MPLRRIDMFWQLVKQHRLENASQSRISCLTFTVHVMEELPHARMGRGMLVLSSNDNCYRVWFECRKKSDMITTTSEILTAIRSRQKCCCVHASKLQVISNMLTRMLTRTQKRGYPHWHVPHIRQRQARTIRANSITPLWHWEHQCARDAITRLFCANRSENRRGLP
eukprot:40386-Amphidinium_carterae.1